MRFLKEVTSTSSVGVSSECQGVEETPRESCMPEKGLDLSSGGQEPVSCNNYSS